MANPEKYAPPLYMTVDPHQDNHHSMTLFAGQQVKRLGKGAFLAVFDLHKKRLLTLFCILVIRRSGAAEWNRSLGRRALFFFGTFCLTRSATL